VARRGETCLNSHQKQPPLYGIKWIGEEKAKAKKRRKMTLRIKKRRGIFERPNGSGIWWIRYVGLDGKLHREKVGTNYADALRAYEEAPRRRQTTRVGQRLAVNDICSGKLRELGVHHFRAVLADLERKRERIDKIIAAMKEALENESLS
jgi:hypothetical protein